MIIDFVSICFYVRFQSISSGNVATDRQTYEKAIEDITKLTQSDDELSDEEKEQLPSVLQSTRERYFEDFDPKKLNNTFQVFLC